MSSIHNYELNESAIAKIERFTNKSLQPPLDMANKPLDIAEKHIDKNTYLQNIKNRLLADPTKLDVKSSIQDWAGVMGASSLLMHSPELIHGEMQPSTALALAGANALKGALIGSVMPGGRDTLAKNMIIPAGVMALTTSPINDLGSSFGVGDDIDFQPEARTSMIAGASAGAWALRHRKNKKREYI